MSNLTFKEKRLISEVLEFDGGYIFTYLGKYERYNKTTTRDIIFGACGIDIFSDPNYSNLSQQKCLERIWEKESDDVAGRVLTDFLQFYIEHYPPGLLEEGEKRRYVRCCEVADRLLSSADVSLPFPISEQLGILLADIQRALSVGNPELCLDRLHTFTAEYLRVICDSHDIPTANAKGEHYPLNSILGSLLKFYRDNSLVQSEFSLIALRNSIDLFSKYNSVRNDQSYAHPNEVLNKAEATYVVQIVSSTLTLIEQIERNFVASEEE